MREVHTTELVTSALYDDTLLRVTGSAATAPPVRRGRSTCPTVPQVRRLLETAPRLRAPLPLRRHRHHHRPHVAAFIDVAASVGSSTPRNVPQNAPAGARRGPPRHPPRPRPVRRPVRGPARGRSPRGGPVRITSPPAATPHAAQRRLLRRRRRSDGPAVPVIQAAVAVGEPIALALRPTTEVALRGNPSYELRRRRAGPPDGPERPWGKTLAARWARELPPLSTAGETGPSASSPSTGTPSTAATADSGPSSMPRPTSRCPIFPSP